MRIKLILSLVIALGLMPLIGASAVELKPIGITVDGKKQEAQGILWDGGFTFVPARTVLESVGAQFSYDAATKTLSATSPVAFSITADQEIGTLNGKPILMDIPPRLINNTFMLPPRTVTQLFNISAIYNSDNQSMEISTAKITNIPYDPYATYNERAALTARFATFGNAHLGKTNWIIGAPLITDQINQPVNLPNLTPVMIEYAEPENLQNTYKLYIKTGDKRYVLRMVNETTLSEYLTYTDPAAKKWPAAVYDAIKQKKVAVGMTKEMVLMSIGKPERVNSSMQSYGVFDQWVYPTSEPLRSNYVYFTNDVVSSIQLSN